MWLMLSSRIVAKGSRVLVYSKNWNISSNFLCLTPLFVFVLRFYNPVNPVGSCRARSVYLTTHLLGRLSPLSG